MRQAINILWPSFLVAVGAEGFFFSVFDPRELMRLNGHELPPIAGYTVGFFFFWVFCALASMLTVYLVKVPNESQPPL
jgi:hypothetical protein